jgi:hypothetical protein
MIVEIEGWFCISKNYPDLSRAQIDQDVFKRSCRRFEINNLSAMSNMERIVGSFFFPTYVVGFVEAGEKGSLIPFFVEKAKAEKLRKLMNQKFDYSILRIT